MVAAGILAIVCCLQQCCLAAWQACHRQPGDVFVTKVIASRWYWSDRWQDHVWTATRTFDQHGILYWDVYIYIHMHVYNAGLITVV